MKVRNLLFTGIALIGLTVPSAFAQAPGTIQNRAEDQQDRIAQGVKSGQLTPGETAHLEGKEKGVNREVRGMREANGGHLTTADRHIVNRQQNRASRQIYRDKHNARRA